MVETTQKRQIAIKCSARDILGGQFVKEEGWTPNYVMINGKKVSRVNIIGALVDKEINESNIRLSVDDGTATIDLVSFEQLANLKHIEIGATVLVIGKPRKYGEDNYIMPETFVEVDKNWLIVRKAELNLVVEEDIESVEEVASVVEKEIITEEEKPQEDSTENIITLIRELDAGEGVTYDDLSMRLKIPDLEQMIQGLLEQGEIFEIRPGKYKVLE